MIPFVDLKTQYNGIKRDIDQAIARVLNSSQFVLGEEVAAFEEEFAAFCQTKYAIGVNSGTSALHLALLAAGIGPGDEVITVPFTFVATVAAIIYTGARPVFVDIDPDSYTMDIDRIETAITSRTKAILPVHLYGQSVDMDPILRIVQSHGLTVIEDAAQAHGAEYKGHRVGGLGDLGCFSFYPGKNLGAYGEGGAVTTNNSEIAKRIRMLRDWGQDRKYHHLVKGYNYRMDGLQGAILRVKLRQIEEWTEARRTKAMIYDDLLSNLDIEIPHIKPFSNHVYHIYAIRVKRREKLREHLLRQGIHTGIHYPIPIHLLPAYSDCGFTVGDFPICERVAEEVLSLPIYPELSDQAIADICSSIKDFQGSYDMDLKNDSVERGSTE